MSTTDYAKHHKVRSQEINTKPVKLHGNICTLLSGLQTKPGLKHNWVVEQRLDLDGRITTEFSGISQEPKISLGHFHQVRINQEKMSYSESNESSLLW